MDNLKLIFLILGVFLSLNLVMADFALGDVSHDLQTTYGTSKPLKGWINISLIDEPADSLLSAFESEMGLQDFLDANTVTYDCFPSDCSSSYEVGSSKLSSKDFSLVQNQEIYIGVNISGDVTSINSLSFDISTTTAESCLSPIEVDVSNDEISEWKYRPVSTSDCSSSGAFGCYQSSSTYINITEVRLCNKITLPPRRAFRIGAVVVGGGSAAFKLSMDEVPCTATTDESGEISCVILFDSESEVPDSVDVCISVDGTSSVNKYKIKYENVEPVCGQSGEAEAEQFYDFEIFAKPQKYSAITAPIPFNVGLIGAEVEISMKAEIMDFISYKYDDDCTNGCLVPIRIKSGISQQLTIDNLNLQYGVLEDLNLKSETGFYVLEPNPALISLGFKKLELVHANLLTPNSLGKKDVILKLGDEELINQEILVKMIPEIMAVFPTKPPALFSTTFVAVMDNITTNMSYTWDFGDDTAIQTTSTNVIKHTYLEIGPYTLKLKIVGSFGESEQLFNLNVVAPADSINQTIIDYRGYVKDLIIKLNDMNPFLRKEMDKLIDPNFLEDKLDKYGEDFKDAISDDEYIKIMQDLIALKVPKSLDGVLSLGLTTFFQVSDEIILENFESLEAGIVDGDKDDYVNAMNNWIFENLDASFEAKTYAFSYDNLPTEYAFSHIKLTLTPKEDIDELYLVINGNPLEIITPVDLNEKDIGEQAKAIILKELVEGETVNIEFIHPDKIDLGGFPMYLSPEFDSLDLEFKPGVCNNNDKCESGENSKNCRNDCKPWGTAFILWVILLVIAFVVYIILQEWYKKHYETHLFKNKNELFNLINFMSVCDNQKIPKEKLFNQLIAKGWKKEQLTYAWNKYKGYRTGMWEIPVFTLAQKLKVLKIVKKQKPVTQPPSPQRPMGGSGGGVGGLRGNGVQRGQNRFQDNGGFGGGGRGNLGVGKR